MKEENYELYIKRFESERLKTKTEREKPEAKTEGEKTWERRRYTFYG